jgi:hypothetical protein
VATEAIEDYVFAVQAEDWDRLFCLSAGAAGSADLGASESERRETFARWARAELDGYLEGRESGRVDLNASPVPLVKALALGKGTYFEVERAVPVQQGGVVAQMDVRLAYETIDLSGLSPGTGFFVCTSPVGTIEHVRVPRFRGEVSADVLDRVPVRWELVRESASDGCAEGWKVNSARVRTEGVTVRTVTWVF